MPIQNKFFEYLCKNSSFDYKQTLVTCSYVGTYMAI